mgnify:CR=1 FL=1
MKRLAVEFANVFDWKSRSHVDNGIYSSNDDEGDNDKDAADQSIAFSLKNQ